MHLTNAWGGGQLQSGAVSPLGRSGDAPPKREREGFFFFHIQSQCYASFHSSTVCSASGNIIRRAF